MVVILNYAQRLTRFEGGTFSTELQTEDETLKFTKTFNRRRFRRFCQTSCWQFGFSFINEPLLPIHQLSIQSFP